VRTRSRDPACPNAGLSDAEKRRKPSYWIPLGSDRTSALRQYERLIAAQGAFETVARIVAAFLDHLAAGGRGAFGRPVRPQSLEQYRASGGASSSPKICEACWTPRAMQGRLTSI